MRIYLAARYSRRDELKGVAEVLRQRGHVITSRWLETDWVSRPDSSTAAPPEYREKYAVIDAQDVAVAELVVSFTEPPAGKCLDCDGLGVVFWPSEDGGSPPMQCPKCHGVGRIDSGRGGRHVEFGLALGLGKRVIVIGHQENLFHHLPQVEFFHGLPAALQSIGWAEKGAGQ